MSPESDLGRREPLSWWLRLPLGLCSVVALAVLLSHRPPLPTMPWATIQPTRGEQIHDTILVIAWLLVALVCLVVGWLALRPSRHEETLEHPPASSAPPRRRRRMDARAEPSGLLLALFATPSLRVAAGVVDTDEAVAISMQPRLRPGVGARARDTPGMLRLFGPLWIDGTDGAGLNERPTRGLIVYLALKRGPVSSDELVEALWPGDALSKTRPRLYKAKRQAQRLLGDALRRRHDGFELDRKQLRCDVDEIERLRSGQLDHDGLEEALVLMAGEPLADVDYPWADSERRRLQAVKAEVLTHVALARRKHGDENGSLAIAEQLIALDPLNERGWCLAMEAESALGQRQAILDRFERLTHELDQRLGLRPGTETREIYHRLLAQR